MGILRDVLCQVGVTTILAKFLVLDIPVDKDVPIVMGRSFLYTCGGILNTIKGTTSTFDDICHQQFPIAAIKAKIEEENSDSEKEIFESRDKDEKPIYGPNNLENDSYVTNPLDTLNPFRKICIWKKIVSFLGSLPVPLQNNDWMTKDAESSYIKVEGDGTWHFKCSIVDPEGNEYNNVFQTKTTERKLSKPCKLSDIIQGETSMMKLDHPDPNAPVNTKLWKKHCCLKFIIHSCCGKDMDRGEEIEEMLEIKVIEMGGDEKMLLLKLRGFSKCLGLYENEDVSSEGFESYFNGGLLSDDNFNAREYWLRISSDDDLQLSRSHAAKIKKPVLGVLQKMISYMDEEERCWELEGQHDLLQSLDRTTLKKLIGSNRRLIPDVPVPGAPRVSMHAPPCYSLEDLYDRMGRIEIRQEAIEQMEYRQSYH
ncbi:hypothetical protein Tco_0682632 [Tanacetum coccineum]|uniref:Uncharacterized protein n=1 Tax=Tanacetum coccineum TaxID=301880 RepID=A0ABQ4XTE8_9ASTR